MENYNDTQHSSIGLAPNEVDEENEDDILGRYFESAYDPQITNKNKFKVGDMVRIVKNAGVFDKRYKGQFSTSVFEIEKLLPGVVGFSFDTYKIKDGRGRTQRGVFKYYELVNANESKDGRERGEVDIEQVEDAIRKLNKVKRDPIDIQISLNDIMKKKEVKQMVRREKKEVEPEALPGGTYRVSDQVEGRREARRERHSKKDYIRTDMYKF